MTALNKQALREMAERAASDSWGYDRDEFNDAITPEVVLALLDELEAKDATIAFQQHEIRTLLGRLENANRAAAAGKGATS
ncbi:ead/Ea22-like family protein [Citrobacter braakii]|uniref:ead/Ea22-like family protein n=1 Tax=Citrobacter braakii TaxID=57706 RepID=UPI0029D54FDF|nr:ead/Ea22-like family protein [Citrobacter braakii]MDX7347669.1 ead/Ea22-like family protein [Citrobacter braakii]